MSNNRTPKTIAQRASDYAQQTSFNASPAQAWADGYRAGIKREPSEVLRLRMALYLRSRDARTLTQAQNLPRAVHPAEHLLPRSPQAVWIPHPSLARSEPVTRIVAQLPGYTVEETNELPVLKLDDTTNSKVWP